MKARSLEQILAGLAPSEGYEWWICPRILSLAYGWPSWCSHGILPVFVPLLKFLFYKDTNHNGLEAYLMSLPELITSATTLWLLSHKRCVTIYWIYGKLWRGLLILLLLLAKMWCWHFMYNEIYTKAMLFKSWVKVLLIYILKAH